MPKVHITKEQTNLIKGIGILLIVLHNYFHWIAPFTGENEFVFDVDNTYNFLNALWKAPTELINTLFSFLGHYGVQLFIFISGYGLAMSYQKNATRFSAFVRKRIVKIYPAFAIAIVLLLLYKFLVQDYLPTSSYLAKLGLKLAMVHTLVPRQALSINGPWWFYGLIVQLYLLFIPLYHLLQRWRWKAFLGICIGSYLLVFTLYQPLLSLDIFVMANFFGHLPEFAFGIFLAMSPNFRWKTWHGLIALLIFTLGNLYFVAFPFSFIAITYLMVWGVLKLSTVVKRGTSLLLFYGKISMFLFAIHAFFRKPYFITIASKTDSALEKIAIGALFLAVVTLLAFLVQQLYKLIYSKTTNG